jgi:leucine-zipper of insertion element IS481
VLLSGDGLGTSAIMAHTGKSKTCVWRWQERFMHEGVDGLLFDKSRPPGRAPIPPKRVNAASPNPSNAKSNCNARDCRLAKVWTFLTPIHEAAPGIACAICGSRAHGDDFHSGAIDW